MPKKQKSNPYQDWIDRINNYMNRVNEAVVVLNNGFGGNMRNLERGSKEFMTAANAICNMISEIPKLPAHPENDLIMVQWALWCTNQLNQHLDWLDKKMPDVSADPEGSVFKGIYQEGRKQLDKLKKTLALLPNDEQKFLSEVISARDPKIKVPATLPTRTKKTQSSRPLPQIPPPRQKWLLQDDEPPNRPPPPVPLQNKDPDSPPHKRPPPIPKSKENKDNPPNRPPPPTPKKNN